MVRCLLLVLMPSVALLIASCNRSNPPIIGLAPTSDPTDYEITFDVMRQASDALAYEDPALSDGTSPKNEFDREFLASDRALHRIKPVDLIGYAFQILVVDDEGTFVFTNSMVLQYDVPAKSCDMDVKWEINAEVIFPRGYQFDPEGTNDLSVEVFAFPDPIGQFSLSETNPALMRNWIDETHGEMGWEWQRGQGAGTVADITGLDFDRWRTVQSNKGPISPTQEMWPDYGRMQGEYFVPAGTESHIFVVASFQFRSGLHVPRADSCIGCPGEIDNLLDAGIFMARAPGATSAEQGFFGPQIELIPRN